MLENLKREVYRANMLLPANNLVTLTWGNASGIDRDSGLFVIKPSGVDYDELDPLDMVVCDLSGNVVEGDMRPSSDTLTHAVLYRSFPDISGVVHTHSSWATSWAQSGRSVPVYGTTHADYFYGDIPCMRGLTEEEIQGNYEENTGKVIVEGFADKDPLAVPGTLVRNHGPFTWGKSVNDAVHHSIILEELCRMAAQTEMINKDVERAPDYLVQKHYERKHGPNAYYGQK